jgi:hypothetical protein
MEKVKKLGSQSHIAYNRDKILVIKLILHFNREQLSTIYLPHGSKRVVGKW